MNYEKYEDRVRVQKRSDEQRVNQHSPYCDLIYYPSSIHPELSLAMRILKPRKPSPICVTTHGWHMSIPAFTYMDTPHQEGDYLIIEVDMRGRAFSDGEPDCNGWELLDVIDAVHYVRKHYADCIINPEVTYFEGGSGGGGNAYAIIGKFPDFFSAATAMCGITDYGMWYEQDEIGEFRDELDVWIGFPPQTNVEAYQSRSGLALLGNVLTPLFIAHGESDIRVPVQHAHLYMQRVMDLGQQERVSYLELEGVGTREHWGNATEEQMRQMRELSEQNRRKYNVPIEIPATGVFTVAGYLITKEFSVILNSLDKVAQVIYDLQKNEFKVTGEQIEGYTIVRHNRTS
ncbi:alpha/beta hydrolase family protein [Paenibacillus sp. FJAT-27812]|uniref:alpha/beta hydrolase family protein n=1 Tax=Paenibacillus sp. FJAT-27812 TaxID=1684143 RepID=UPI0006A769A8|nr:prolyl oligopeptidase family serine peptidase [Paenibacillus sp. FJAT-27812]